MGRRTLLLLAALVVAALGTVLVFLYASNAKNAAQEGQSLVKVLVAKSKIEIGTTGTAASANGAFEERQVPKDTAVDGVLSDATPIANLVALVPVFPGQQIIGQQWGATQQTSGLALPTGTIAISVQLGDPERVAGFVSPGSSITVFAQPSNGATDSVRTLLTKIPVIAVGPSTVVSRTVPASGSNGSGTANASGNTEQIPTAILTLAVTQEQAEKIIYASGKVSGSTYSALWFGLEDKNSKVTPSDPGIGSKNLFG
jgi:pilus assembly protein CpaB